ncbi:MAG: hydrolase [Novosphingobium sp.]
MNRPTLEELRLVEPIERQPMLDHVLDWAGVNSGTGNLAGLDVVAELLVEAFSRLPGEIELIDPDPVEKVAANGNLETIVCGQHLLVRVRPDANQRVLLTGHMDTVFAADHAFQHCTWIDESTLCGPGTADMKGGLALMLSGLLAFEASGPDLGYDVLINSDEETGSRSSARIIGELAQGKFAALTYEPSLPGGVMARARPGSGNFAAVVTGRPAHAGRNPEEGRNAIVAAADFALRLAKARQPSLGINPARIDGGGPDNMVPELAIVRFNVRPVHQRDADEAATILENIRTIVSDEHDVAIRIHGGFGRPPKLISEGTERLFALVARTAADLGEPLDWKDTGGVCDGNNIAAMGVPVIDTMGALGGEIHSPGEFLLVDTLVARARLTALVLHRLSNGGLP